MNANHPDLIERVEAWLRERADQEQKWIETMTELPTEKNGAPRALREAAMLIRGAVLPPVIVNNTGVTLPDSDHSISLVSD